MLVLLRKSIRLITCQRVGDPKFVQILFQELDVDGDDVATDGDESIQVATLDPQPRSRRFPVQAACGSNPQRALSPQPRCQEVVHHPTHPAHPNPVYDTASAATRGYQYQGLRRVNGYYALWAATTVSFWFEQHNRCNVPCHQWSKITEDNSS